jgi:hypothetical protein
LSKISSVSVPAIPSAKIASRILRTLSKTDRSSIEFISLMVDAVRNIAPVTWLFDGPVLKMAYAIACDFSK